MKSIAQLVLIISAMLSGCSSSEQQKGELPATASRDIWTKEQANDWYSQQPWYVGADFLPSTAINQLEMWQAESFDSATIEKELSWAEDLGMNTMRVYLHDLLWQQDSLGFLNRIDTFLAIADRHGIKPMFVFFDSCWDPFPKLGKQRAPKPGVHNSGWVQSPGYEALKDSGQYARLEAYTHGVVRKFADDDRIMAWDIWNEPDNPNTNSYGKLELPNKVDYVLPLLKKAFAWARAENPSQPLTAGVWQGDWSSPAKLTAIEKVSIDESDIISFHNYENGEEFEKRIEWLRPYGRPMICTEYMSRGNNSTFDQSLPIAKKHKVGAISWGLVSGKSQTIYPWDSWKKQYASEPDIWFHDIFRPNGKPYRQAEVDLIKELTGKKAS